MDDSTFPPEPPPPSDSPLPHSQSPESQSFASGATHPWPASTLIIGHALNRALESYFAQWLNWLLPVCLSIFLGLASACGICLPLLLFGPLAGGLFGCALAALVGRQVNLTSLRHGWRHFLTTCFAGLLLMMLNFVPLVILVCMQMAAIGLTVGFNGPNQQQGAQPVVLALIFPLQMVGMMLTMLWTIWIGTRTMFVLPTIVDRGYSLSAALDVSWEATRGRFWELMFLNFIAVMLGIVGMYLCYVGVILTAPLYFLTIAAAYDARVGCAHS
jgi:hypothetical protein